MAAAEMLSAAKGSGERRCGLCLFLGGDCWGLVPPSVLVGAAQGPNRTLAAKPLRNHYDEAAKREKPGPHISSPIHALDTLSAFEVGSSSSPLVSKTFCAHPHYASITQLQHNHLVLPQSRRLDLMTS